MLEVLSIFLYEMCAEFLPGRGVAICPVQCLGALPRSGLKTQALAGNL